MWTVLYSGNDRLNIPRDDKSVQTIELYLMALLGHLSIIFNDLDGALDELLAHLSFTSDKTASILFDGETYSRKIEKCKRLVDAAANTHEEGMLIKRLIDNARVSLNERNNYIHAYRWSYNNETGEISASRLRRNRDAETWNFTLTDLQAVIDKVTEARDEIFQFIDAQYVPIKRAIEPSP